MRCKAKCELSPGDVKRGANARAPGSQNLRSMIPGERSAANERKEKPFEARGEPGDCRGSYYIVRGTLLLRPLIRDTFATSTHTHIYI